MKKMKLELVAEIRDDQDVEALASSLRAAAKRFGHDVQSQEWAVSHVDSDYTIRPVTQRQKNIAWQDRRSFALLDGEALADGKALADSHVKTPEDDATLAYIMAKKAIAEERIRATMEAKLSIQPGDFLTLPSNES